MNRASQNPVSFKCQRVTRSTHRKKYVADFVDYILDLKGDTVA